MPPAKDNGGGAFDAIGPENGQADHHPTRAPKPSTIAIGAHLLESSLPVGKTRNKIGMNENGTIQTV